MRAICVLLEINAIRVIRVPLELNVIGTICVPLELNVIRATFSHAQSGSAMQPRR
jgi:hypothetical protein